MPFDVALAYNTFLPLAENAYNSFLSKPLALPDGWVVVSILEPVSFGYLVENKGLNILAACFRGTQTEREWEVDFDGLAVPAKYAEGWVHQGFQRQYEEIRASFMPRLISMPLTQEIWLTGHSLGAALATLCQADLIRAGYKTLCYTFAGPRVGWSNFATWFDRTGAEHNRIVNTWDIVPDVPPVINGYRHVGYQVIVNGPKPDFSIDFKKGLHFAHSLTESYRPGLAVLQK